MHALFTRNTDAMQAANDFLLYINTNNVLMTKMMDAIGLDLVPSRIESDPP